MLTQKGDHGAFSGHFFPYILAAFAGEPSQPLRQHFVDTNTIHVVQAKCIGIEGKSEELIGLKT